MSPRGSRRLRSYNPPLKRRASRARPVFPMHVFFEDDGHLKAGTVLADNDASLQVEAASGKRLKIKAAAVLLRFAEPSPSALNADAQTLAGEIDPDFLWEVSPDDEFGFSDLARDYVGRTPLPAEAAAVALTLAGAPMYFYRRGKGRYRKAPPDALKAAIASIERKKREKSAFSWLAFWRSDEPKVKAAQYRVAVSAETDSSRVQVQDKNGAAESSVTSRRILTLLHEQLK